MVCLGNASVTSLIAMNGYYQEVGAAMGMPCRVISAAIWQPTITGPNYDAGAAEKKRHAGVAAECLNN